MIAATFREQHKEISKILKSKLLSKLHVHSLSASVTGKRSQTDAPGSDPTRRMPPHEPDEQTLHLFESPKEATKRCEKLVLSDIRIQRFLWVRCYIKDRYFA